MNDGYGTKIGYADTEVASPTWLSNVLKITPGKKSTTDLSIKPLDSTSHHVEHAPGSFVDTEPHTFQLPHTAALETTLNGLLRLVKFWTIQRADGSGKRGWGYLSDVSEGEISADNLATLDASIRPTDAWTPYSGDGAIQTITFTTTLAAGAATIDLTAMVDAVTGLTVNGTGKKVVGLKITNHGDTVLTVAAGASNGYLLRTADSDVKIDPNDTVILTFTNSQTIAAGDKTLDLTGNGTETSTWEVTLQ